MIKRKPEEPVSDEERTGIPPFSMEPITSRKNSRVQALRRLGREKAYRREQRLFLCDGEKLLSEAIANGADIAEIYLRGVKSVEELPGVPVYALSEDVFDYASPLEHSPGPLFTVRTKTLSERVRPDRVIVLENVQDPGNVGTVLRTAAALGTELVVLVGECADPYNPKTVRAAMGALFRQPIWETDLSGLCEKLHEWELLLCGAALRAESVDVKSVSLRRSAVAIGNEGRGLTEALLAACDQKIILPMTPGSESLNAAVAASIFMWEMWTQRG